jgi:hypothetical protein
VGVTDRWVEVRDDLLFFFHLSIFKFFNWTDKWAPVHINTYRTPTYQIRCQFAFNSVRIAKNYPNSVTIGLLFCIQVQAVSFIKLG